jgi:two-component system sensor histidine kinase VicK
MDIISDFEQQVNAAKQYLDTVHEKATGETAPQEELLTGTIEELNVTVEELHVAVEEQRIQNNQLKAAQEELIKERKRYQSLFELAPDGYLITDQNAVVREANWAAAVLLDVAQEFLIGKPLASFVVESDRPKFYAKLTKISELRKLNDWEIHMQPRNRNQFPVAIAISSIRNSAGEISGLRWIIRDISKLKQAEETIRRQLVIEQEISYFKSRIIQTVSHEFRTPLTIVRTSTELLEKYGDRIDEVKQKQYFQKIKASIQYVNQLLNGVSVLSEPDFEALAPQCTPIDLGAFCQKLIEEIQLTHDSNCEIHFINKRQHQFVDLDHNLLHQILSNLLSNAVKYSVDDGDIYFELEQQADHIIFQIKDSGIGISSEDQLHLFEPFYKAHNVENIAGTGLGLAIAKKAVERHGGVINLQSEIGKGTTVTVTLPLNQ